MNVLAVSFIALASGLLASSVFWSRQAELPHVGALVILLGAFWIFQVARRPSSRTGTAFLAVFAGLTVIIVAQAGWISPTGWLLPTLALSAALYGWDSSNTARRLAAFPRVATARFAVRYGAWSLVLSASGILLCAASFRLRLRLSFPLALVLALGALTLALYVVHSTAPSCFEPSHSTKTPPHPAGERKDKPDDSVARHPFQESIER